MEAKFSLMMVMLDPSSNRAATSRCLPVVGERSLITAKRKETKSVL